MSALTIIARVELVAAARLKWIRLLTLAFALLAAAAAYAAGAANDIAGAGGFVRTTMTLVPVTLILVPLAALVLGISGQVCEPGGEALLYGQPIGRATVLVGRWLGECAALSASIGAGLGVGGVVVAIDGQLDGIGGYLAFIAAAAVLGVVFLSIAAAVASTTSSRVAALGTGTFVWFVFVLLYDAAALALAGWITGSTGGRVLFVSVFGNPADLIRVVMLTLSGTPHVLGAAGDAWIRFLGGTAWAAVAAAGALAAWTIVPLAAGARLLAARDL